ncbi:MAG: branched-chain-amino-acid transaminase [Candidatus Calescibacterium sp.]|nr:branched-chain-amino-acid transaminase [Candidatus Calescibacterium sp.]MCX7758937.1 branched-chain-amino-acid transaminase [bacterium]
MKVFINGKLLNKEEAKISVWDHGFLYGDGVFEGIRVYNNSIFKLDEHLIRLYDSARVIELSIPYTYEEMKNHLINTVKINLEEEKIENAYIRLVVSRGEGDLGLDPRKCKNPTVIIIVDKIQLYPKEFYEKGLKLIISSYRRPSADILSPRIKSLNYLNNILAKIEANNANAQEAIMLNQNGYITECTADNIFIVHNGKVKTPPAYVGILEGITRESVLQMCKELNIESEEVIIDVKDLLTAQEVFITGTGAEIVPIKQINNIEFNIGKTTQKLIEYFPEFVRKNSTPVFVKV